MFLRNTLLCLSLIIVLSNNAFAQRTTVIESTPPGRHNQDETALIDDTDRKPAAVVDKETRQELYAKLEKKLTNTRWVGNFTVTGKDLSNLTPEEYEILSAKKVDEGEYWLLKVRIKYGKNDITLPLPPLEILWAGRTPIITVDRLSVPGLGTFDARVIIRGDKYAGTWAHDAVGGHLFGTIESLPSESKPEEKKKDSKDKK